MSDVINALGDEVLTLYYSERAKSPDAEPDELLEAFEIVLTPEQWMGIRLEKDAHRHFLVASAKPVPPTFMGLPVEVIPGYTGPRFRPRGYTKHRTT